MTEAWIIDAARTPRAIGKPGKGAYSGLHPQHLLSTVLQALAERNGIETRDVDDVIAGCGTQWGEQSSCIARMAALDAGWDNAATGFAIDRFCGSGLTAVNIGAMGVMSGMQKLVVAGGVESMSHSWAFKRYPTLDSENLHLRKLHPQAHQGICADLIATVEGISRHETELFAVESQRRAGVATTNGHFQKGLVPVHRRDGTLALSVDEYPRPSTTAEDLAGLKPAFADMYDKPWSESGESYQALVRSVYPDIRLEHVHHAGNSSGVVDGAGAVVIASKDYAESVGWKPRARIVTVATAGDSPELMLTAAGPAAQKALKTARMTAKDVDLFEVNEAFAVVPMKFMRDLGIGHDVLNVNGGAIALGHPIGATGAMLLGTVLDELERRDLSTGLVTMCTGGGMAPCTIIERL